MSVYPVSNYVIFAAGVGSRMNTDVPKFLVNIGDHAVFEYQLSQLATFPGCIFIVCGFRADVVCRQVVQYIDSQQNFLPRLCFVYNPDYSLSQVTSIARALDSIPRDRPSFFIDGDLLFHRQSIASLHGQSNATVVVRNDVSRDAVTATTEGDRLVRFQRGGSGDLEWANIAKYLPSDLARLTKITLATRANHHFDLINELVKAGSRVHVQESSVAEIDQPEDLPAAIAFAAGLP